MVDAGIKVYFFLGNHDMWMKKYFKEELGVIMIENELEIKINDKSFYISHGSEDEVLPFNQAKESLNFLNQNNIVFDFETYPVGHGVCPENFKSMLSWLNNKML